MYTFIVKSSSWHHRLAYKYTNFFPARNLCEYTTHVFLGLFLASLLTALVGLTLGSVVAGILFLVTYGWQFLLVDPELAEGAGVCIIIVSIMVALWIGVGDLCHYIEFSGKPKQYKEPGFIKQAFTSFKDKMCIRVQVEE